MASQTCISASLTQKGVFIDGHKRNDVKEYCKLLLRKFGILESTHLPPPLTADGK